MTDERIPEVGEWVCTARGEEEIVYVRYQQYLPGVLRVTTATPELDPVTWDWSIHAPPFHYLDLTFWKREGKVVSARTHKSLIAQYDMSTNRIVRALNHLVTIHKLDHMNDIEEAAFRAARAWCDANFAHAALSYDEALSHRWVWARTSHLSARDSRKLYRWANERPLPAETPGVDTERPRGPSMVFAELTHLSLLLEKYGEVVWGPDVENVGSTSTHTFWQIDENLVVCVSNQDVPWLANALVECADFGTNGFDEVIAKREAEHG